MRPLYLALAALNFAIAFLAAAILVLASPSVGESAIGILLCAFLGTRVLAAIAGVVYGLVAPDLESTGQRGVYCRACRYDLRSLHGGRCPECGRPFEASDPRTYARYAAEPSRWPAPLATTWIIAAGLLFGCGVLLFLRFVSPFW